MKTHLDKWPDMYNGAAIDYGNTTDLLFAYPEGVKLTSRYNHIVVTTCTFDTNRPFFTWDDSIQYGVHSGFWLHGHNFLL